MRAGCAAAIVVIACGRTTPPAEVVHEAPSETSVTGTLAGAPFVARSAASNAGGGESDAGSPGYPGLTVRILDGPGACDELNRRHHAGRSLRLFVINPVDANPIGAGTYALLHGEKATATFAMASVHTYDAECHDSSEMTGEGSVTLTEVGDVVRGTFDVTFAEHDGRPAEHVTGRFAAPRCTLNETDAGTCG